MIKKEWMKKAIILANENEQKHQGAPFGAVVVKSGKVIGTGVNQVSVINDPTAHAEIQAIREACQTLNTTNLKDCEIYTSTEPCPMCLSAIYYTQIDTVYFSNLSNPSQDYVYNQLSLPHDERDIHMVRLKE
ncbi:nucleoside deaminase [Oceanobacillus neutriphilus]|uniref:tRNA-specific adenosine deaminase n=1 Tax=Oceanobacillus neutriphilus TaxID=531815 RepID=A0ABQ2NUG9_9BACI|nr:nucleoside deaminase [Oceanobacillus neutriphilus]GGP10812.1 tRNA-specific adenosine deaminase [Oceanobacillus neutriphilus]